MYIYALYVYILIYIIYICIYINFRYTQLYVKWLGRLIAFKNAPHGYKISNNWTPQSDPLILENVVLHLSKPVFLGMAVTSWTVPNPI